MKRIKIQATVHKTIVIMDGVMDYDSYLSPFSLRFLSLVYDCISVTKYIQSKKNVFFYQGNPYLFHYHTLLSRMICFCTHYLSV